MSNPVVTRKKLIEVALPLEAINTEGSRRKRKAPAGYPTTLHKWWAQRPLAAARAVIFAQMVDDPSEVPEEFPTVDAQEAERQRLFRLVEQLVLWENTTNDGVIRQARDEIWHSWRRACADNASHPHAEELFNPEELPVFHDPFAGGGSLPLEAQRLGLEAYASDLNPVAVLINKAMIEIPPKFTGKPPVNPTSRTGAGSTAAAWKGAAGLAEDVRYYGKWMREEAEKRIGHLYPKVAITKEMTEERPDLEPYLGRELTVIAWLWARTVKSPNPAFRDVDVPLASTFLLSTTPGKEAHVEPLVEQGGYRFTVKKGKPRDPELAKSGTKLSRGANFRCVMSDSPITGDYIKAEGRAGRMGARMMAVVADGDRSRLYLEPTAEMEATAQDAQPAWRSDIRLAPDPRALWTPPYGFTTFGDLFTDRQLVGLTTFSDLVAEVRELVRQDAGEDSDADAYADAIGTYLSIAISRLADYGSSIATWRPKDNAMRSTMPKQGIQMSWDFAEGSPFGGSSSGFVECVEVVAKVLLTALAGGQGHAIQANAQNAILGSSGVAIVSTDPPYYDNIGYADLSDFFYVYLRRSLRGVYPDLFSTLASPKTEELVAIPYRHQGREAAETFFLDGMTSAMRSLAAQVHPVFPMTVYYAFKQSETGTDSGTASTGWETFLDAMIRADLMVTGTLPMRTEGDNRQVGIGSNALASSIVLVCRPRPDSALAATRGQFMAALMAELPPALKDLQHGNIAPVDLAQAAIGPGMAVFTRYSEVLDASGEPMKVREALALINQVLDEALAEQEGDFDADSRWALAWFEQAGFNDGRYGLAETLSKAKNTSIDGLVEAGVLASGRGTVRLLRPAELKADWDPEKDRRLIAWESVHQLVRALETGGESPAAALAAKLGSHAETARELCYRLYTLCERKKRASEALSYNALVQSWPEIMRLAQETPRDQLQRTLL